MERDFALGERLKKHTLSFQGTGTKNIRYTLNKVDL